MTDIYILAAFCWLLVGALALAMLAARLEPRNAFIAGIWMLGGLISFVVALTIIIKDGNHGR